MLGKKCFQNHSCKEAGISVMTALWIHEWPIFGLWMWTCEWLKTSLLAWSCYVICGTDICMPVLFGLDLPFSLGPETSSLTTFFWTSVTSSLSRWDRSDSRYASIPARKKIFVSPIWYLSSSLMVLARIEEQRFYNLNDGDSNTAEFFCASDGGGWLAKFGGRLFVVCICAELIIT